MSSRQRSFFDQKASYNRPWRHRRPWLPKSTRDDQQYTNPPLTRPAIAASSQARRKLDNFRYCAAPGPMFGNAIQQGNKENASQPTTDDPRQVAKSGKSAEASSILPLISDDCLQSFPQTPVPRVPFTDLVDNGSVIRTNSSPTKTPPVHVAWKQSPTSSDSESAWTQYHNKRKRKRARSTSPNQNSSQHSLHIDKAFFLPIADTSKALDPAVELEKRLFGDRAGASTGLGIDATPCKPKVTSSASAELMRSSSPTTPGTALTESAKLRRTRSCGIAFPTSGDRKRRRLSSGGTTKQILERPIDDKLARISALLDMVDGGLLNRTKGTTQVKADEEQRFEASTQTSWQDTTRLKRSALQHVLSETNAETLRNKRASRQLVTAVAEELGANRLSQTVASLSIQKTCSSEFGGDDIEDEFFSIAAVENQSQPSPDYPGTSNSQQHPAHCSEAGIPPIGESAPPEKRNDRASAFPDDDDDDDEDEFMKTLFAAELEEVAATYDQGVKPVNEPPKKIHSGTDALQEADTTTEPAERNLPSQSEQELLAAAIDVSSDEDFGGEDFEDIAQEFNELTQAAEKEDFSSAKPALIPRYTVKQISDSTYTASNRFTRDEKIIQLQEERTKSPKIVHLREAWLDSPCPIGATVHVIGTFSKQGSLVVDNANNLLVVHPDHLLSATVVADAFKCVRRAVLQDRVKATSEVNESQVFGHILHEVFQECLKANQWKLSWLESVVRTVAGRYLESLFELNLPIERAVEELLNKLQELEDWARLFVSTKAKPGAQLKGPNETFSSISINKLLDVEEHVWSPLYGLKGNIDATVQVHAPDGQNPNRQLTVPFELKTGRATNNTSHNSQTALYTLLLSDRYDVQIGFGILYYLETNSMSQILGQRKDIIHMIMKRNELACYTKSRSQLPPMLKNEHTCSRCYAQSSCFVYHKLVEDGDGKTSGMGSKFKELMGHLSPKHAEFFKKWDALLTKEERDVFRFRGELWSMLSTEREKVGRCFAGVVIKPETAIERVDTPKINRFEYVFVKQKVSSHFSFADSQINLGEPIVVSDESGHYALANGYVTKIRQHEISVAVDRRLHNARSRDAGFDATNNQTFAGIMEVNIDDKEDPNLATSEPSAPLVYRIDKDEFSNGMALVRNNLIRIMGKDQFGAMPLRRLVIENVAPSFRPINNDHATFSSNETTLNVDQRNAIGKVLAADDYALVLGMPGTGKTTTISHIIRALVAKGKSILLTSYTHTAVDNILLKIRDDKLSILRLGAESKIHPEVQEFADLACRPKSSYEEIQRSYQSKVVATTCLGINHPIFNQRTFDYCIVDEASQITLPVCLGPIRMAHTFVLVGDHYQLPPLVQNKEAQEGGLDISLFKLLSDNHPGSVVNLEHQYRMCDEIMSLSNTLIYSGMLKCGTPEVARKKLDIPDMAALKQYHHTLETLGSTQSAPCLGAEQTTCWLRKVLDPARSVVFINTDTAGDVAKEIVTGSRITNPYEVSLTTQIVRSLVAVGVSVPDIGVIALYRSQLGLLRHSLRPRHSTAAPELDAVSRVEMHTADKFQGRDKEVVVLDLVRSNDKNIVGDLLQDWRRVNVALTRARTKLIIVGSFSTMKKGNDLLEKMCSLIDRNDWRLDIQPRALEEHCFTDFATQSSSVDTKADTRSIRGVKIESPVRAGAKGMLKLSPVKRGKRMSPERILKSRPVLHDIINGVVG